MRCLGLSTNGKRQKSLRADQRLILDEEDVLLTTKLRDDVHMIPTFIW